MVYVDVCDLCVIVCVCECVSLSVCLYVYVFMCVCVSVCLVYVFFVCVLYTSINTLADTLENHLRRILRPIFKWLFAVSEEMIF